MERLTARDEDGDIAIINKHDPDGSYFITDLDFDDDADILDSVAEKLAEYEDAEEQGLIIRLPCSIGDTVYDIIDDEIFPSMVMGYEYDDDSEEFEIIFRNSFSETKMPITDMDGSVFLTQFEAEQALKGMEDDI